MAKNNSATEQPGEKAQLVLVLSKKCAAGGVLSCVEKTKIALSAGSVAAVIIPAYDLSEPDYAELAAAVIPVVQETGAAALLDGLEATQILGRLDADGIMLEVAGENWIDDTLELLQRFEGQRSVGLYGNFDRDKALMAGDVQPDLVMFGPLGGDIKPEPHRKNLKLAEWWASMIEIPCLIPAGSDVNSVVEASETLADFICLSRAVFDGDDPAKTVADALVLIDEQAPELMYDDAG